MDHCRNYFSYLGNKLAYVPHLGYLSAGTPSTSKIKGYICEWENGANTKKADGTGVAVYIGGNKVLLNGKIAASSGIDTDHDGVSDYNEVDVNAIKKIGGSSAQTITWKQGHDYLNNKGYISDKSYDKIADLVKDLAQNQEIYPAKSNPADVDSDGDDIKDANDPNPNQSDVTVHKLSQEDYLKIIYNGEQRYGCDQSWLNDIDEEVLKAHDLSSTFACGLVAAGDLIAYLNLYTKINMKDFANDNGFSKLADTTPINDLYNCYGYNESNDTIDYYKYMNYIAKLSDIIKIYDATDGAIAIGPNSIKSCLNKIFKYNSDSKYDYTVHWRNNNAKDKLKERIRKSLGNNLPVIISFDHPTPDQEDLKFYTKSGEVNFKDDTTTTSHYMVITEITEYSKDAAKVVGHSTMIKVASWSRDLYVDLDEYSDIVNSDVDKKMFNHVYNNFASNILEIGRKKK